MRMNNLIEKIEAPINCPVLRLNDDKVKGLNSYKVGDTCELHIIGKVTSISESYDKKSNDVAIDVHKVGFESDDEEPQSEGDKRETIRMNKALGIGGKKKYG